MERTMRQTEPRLTKEQAQAWQALGEEWTPFRDAWLRKGLPWPPRGAPDDPSTPRGLLWPIARTRSDDLGGWVRAAPTHDPYSIIAYVLGRWEAKGKSPLTTAEAKSALSRLVDIMPRQTTIDPRPGEAATSGDGHDTGGGGTVPPPSQRLPSRPDDTPHDRRSPCCDAEAIRYLTSRGYTVEAER